MANQVAARLAGDDYQHLIAWLRILDLLIPHYHVRRVTVEDAEAGFVDDVTTQHDTGAKRPDEFLQVKYHVDQRDQYSTALLLFKKTTKTRSVLEKMYVTWRALTKNDPDRAVELRLISNWTWDVTDPVAKCIQGKDNALSPEFFSADRKTSIGEVREKWREHLGVDDGQFAAFAATLRFRLGFDCSDELAHRAAERMMFLKLKHDAAALLLAVGIVRDLVKTRRADLERRDVETLLTEHDLHLPDGEEAATVVYLSTVKQQQFDVRPDFLLDWGEYFEGDSSKRGHRVLFPDAWNGKMLPEVQQLEMQLNAQSAPRLIRARGLARLSAWFGFGHTFSDVARYTIEVDQQGQLWRTDEQPSELAVIEHAREAVVDGDHSAVAIGISVTGSLDDDVRQHVRESRGASAILLLRPNRDLGRDSFKSAGDATAFARSAKERMRAFVKEHGATRLLLFYFGPLSGACFLGHQLNAIAREIQIMEDQQPGYAPSFVLK